MHRARLRFYLRIRSCLTLIRPGCWGAHRGHSHSDCHSPPSYCHTPLSIPLHLAHQCPKLTYPVLTRPTMPSSDLTCPDPPWF